MMIPGAPRSRCAGSTSCNGSCRRRDRRRAAPAPRPTRGPAARARRADPGLHSAATDDAFEHGRQLARPGSRALGLVPLDSDNHILLGDEPAWQVSSTRCRRSWPPTAAAARATRRAWSRASARSLRWPPSGARNAEIAAGGRSASARSSDTCDTTPSSACGGPSVARRARAAALATYVVGHRRRVRGMGGRPPMPARRTRRSVAFAVMTQTQHAQTVPCHRPTTPPLKAKHAAMWAMRRLPGRRDRGRSPPLGPASSSQATGVGPGDRRPRRRRRLRQRRRSPPRQPGADVVASDLTPDLLETGRQAAAGRCPTLRGEMADAEHLPYADAEFARPSPASGVMFAPDHQEAADGLRPACAAGGRVGLLSWTPGRVHRPDVRAP